MAACLENYDLLISAASQCWQDQERRFLEQLWLYFENTDRKSRCFASQITLGLTILRGLLPPTTQQEKITSSAHSFPSACRAALRCQLSLCEIGLHVDKAPLQTPHMMICSEEPTSLSPRRSSVSPQSADSREPPLLDGLPLAD